MYRTYNARPLPRPLVHKRSHLLAFMLTSVVVLFAVGGYIGYALLRPLPPLQITLTPPVLPALVTVNSPWPVEGQAAYGANGYGLLAQKDSSKPEVPAPMASVAKTITALAVLSKQPLSPGTSGPAILITQADVDIYKSYVASDGSVVPVYAGETITQYQALQALMLPSANNIADTLAIWAFGSLQAYNQYASSYVQALGMSHTTITDASGFASTTVSTAADLVKLADKALDNPVLVDIVSQKTAEFPEVGTIRNVNTLLGQSGIRGIKTGNTEAAGGCYLAIADILIGGKKISLITAVMGAPSLAVAMQSSLPLIQSAPSQFQTVQAVRAGQIVGTAKTTWGAKSAIAAKSAINVTAWVGTAVAAKASPVLVTVPATAHTTAGQLSLNFNGTKQTAVVELTAAVAKPNLWWKLSHPF